MQELPSPLMRRAFAWSALTVAAAVGMPMEPAAAACPVAEIITPERDARVGQPRPAIEWRALPGVTRYRIQLESRVPEGRSLHTTDSIVAGTRFVPPVDLTDSRAAVKLLVTAECAGESPFVTELAAWFYLDLSGQCATPADIQVAAPPAAAFSWTPVASALRYEVALYSALDGKLLAREETIAPRYGTGAPDVPYYVMVRARCAAGYSAPVYRASVPAR
jgi:hypothetical protein